MRIIKRVTSLAAVLALALGVLIGFQLPANAVSCQSSTYRSQVVHAGSRGSAARAAQCLLRKVGYKVAVDGSFSAADAATVKAFQRKHHLSVSGRVGPLTWRALVRTAKAAKAAPRTVPTSRSTSRPAHACLPVNTHRIAARFGARGPWARYHTGIDFSASSGTPIHAVLAGVVTHAGTGGRAGSWAGKYVVIRHANGVSTLYAHMSRTSVSVGARVAACAVIGRVGQTGRAFGPHVHFEVYPRGITPGNVYKAVNPAPWLAKLGLHV